MKYRMLSNEEMEIFNEDFKHFLIANGVSNEDWIEFNNSNLEKATKLVQLFSDTVLQKVYEKVKYIEFRNLDNCMIFECLRDKMNMISVNKKSDSTVNLSTPESIHTALVNHPNELTIFKTEKKYSLEREIEIHQMISQGCVNSSQDFWESLLKLVK